MPEFVRTEVRSRVAVITIDHPPVNALAEGMREEIRDAVQRAETDDGVDAIVLIGHGTTFVAGADLRALTRSRRASSRSSARRAFTRC